MPKHRSPGFAVVREVNTYDGHADDPTWAYSGLVGVYQSIQRAEEVAASTIQRYIDMGMKPESPEYRCTVNPTNWYDE